jgi:adenylate cyclase
MRRARSLVIAVSDGLAAATADAPEERRLRFRIGIHLDDILWQRRERRPRLQTLAEPGGLTVSDLVQGPVRGAVKGAFVEQGTHDSKNIGRPHGIPRGPGHMAVSPGIPATAGRPAASARPAVAVLPLSNMSGNASQAYVADGSMSTG